MKISLFTVILTIALSNSVEAQGPQTVVINELLAMNSSASQDPQGQYDDWVELYNYGDSTVNIGGMYLTDDLADPTKWQIPAPALIPAGDYLLIWTDRDTADTGLHADFRLNGGGEELGLFNSDGTTLVDSIIYGPQTRNVSFGRYPDAGDEWRFFDEPSPAGANAIVFEGFVEDVQFSHTRGFYDESFYLTLATETEGTEIYYTTNFSEPNEIAGRTMTGTLYTAPVLITRTTCIRAVAFKPGWRSSNLATRTYIFLDDVIRQPTNPAGFPTSWGNRTADYAMDQRVVDDPAYSGEIKDDLKSTPSVCIVIDNADFFGSGGIYANATRTGEQWERAASIEWIDPNTGGQFGVTAGLRIHGGPYSRSGSSKNALRIIFRGQYGLSKLDYPLFPDTEVSSFNTLALRAIWNYSWTGHSGMSGSQHADYLRDAFARDTIRDMERLTPHGRGVQVYINGLYWGMYIMTERPDEHFVADHLGGDRENYDILEAPSGMGASTTMEVISGGEQARQAWNELFEVANTNLTTLEAYETIQTHVDIPTMIDYMLMVYYTGSRDAPVFLGDSFTPRNFYVTRLREPAGPFVLIPWDTEWSLEESRVNRVNVVGVWNPHYLVDRFLDNSDFRMLMADHIHRHFFNDGVLTSDRSTERYLALAQEINGAIVGESARWGDSRRSYRPYTRDIEWVGEVNRLVNEYFSVRTDTVLGQLRRADFYPSITAAELYVNNQSNHGGHISQTDRLSMTSEEGTIFYTLDGSDPRLPGSSQQGDTIGTVLVPENATKRILVPTGSIGSDWYRSQSFNDSVWLNCVGNPGGIGYERSSGFEDLITLNLESRMYGTNTTCYIRIPFTFSDSLDNLDFITLNVRYDDGFIAYLNGVEVARRNFTGTPGWNSSAISNHSDNEAVNFEEIDISDFRDNLQQGDNLLAIHAMNSSVTSSDFLISVQIVANEEAIIDNNSDILSPGAIEYTEPFTLDASAPVKARVLSNGNWSALNEATFAVGSVADNLRITEIMYNPYGPDGTGEPNEEFIELKNIGTETINLNLVKLTNGVDFIFPNLELAPNEYVVVVQDIAAFEARYGQDINVAGQYSGRLNNAGERIELEDAIGQTILDFSYRDGWRSVADGDGFSLTIIDPTATDDWNDGDSWRASAYIGGSPGSDDSGIIPNPGAIVINELLANSPGNSPDWIELYNTTDTSIDISGWYISDSGSNLTKYQIAAGTSIPANGYIVFYEDRHFGNPSLATPFALSADGEIVYLSSAENGVLTGYRQVEDFGTSATGVSFGRYYKPSTGNYNFVAMSENTSGSVNSAPQVGPIVINEIMYNPSWPNGGSYTNDQYEYVELYNMGSEPVSLEGWQFTDGIDFTFPMGGGADTIPAGGYLLVVRHPDAFVWRYPTVPADTIYGPYEGNLSNAGERLELSTDDDIRVDRISFSDGSHPEDCPGGIDLWPVEADGAGQSLARQVTSEYGNDPDNWGASAPSPGTENP